MKRTSASPARVVIVIRGGKRAWLLLKQQTMYPCFIHSSTGGGAFCLAAKRTVYCGFDVNRSGNYSGFADEQPIHGALTSSVIETDWHPPQDRPR